MVRPTSAHLGSSATPGRRLLVLGDGVLLGASSQGLTSGGLPDAIARELRDQLGDSGLVDVLWDLHSSMRTVARLSADRRLQPYDALVVIAEAQHVPASSRRLRQTLQSAWPLVSEAPQVVVVLASNASDERAAARAEARVQDIAATLPENSTPIVVHAGVSDGGEVQAPDVVAAAVVRLLGSPARTEPHDSGTLHDREMAVDRSLRALRGHTSHLRRALVLAQNSFGVPYAQLNLVSRGTLRSLAFIGRSSDGLERSLSAEAVHQGGPLLVADTQAVGRFSDIPETHGPDAIRYYVGHPVRANSGHAVGVLCVLDTQPHDIDPSDATLIRDLALLVEGELAALSDEP